MMNSLWRWYEEAAVCYAYLTDVSDVSTLNANDAINEQPGLSAFRRSKWFTRGWTLQELIAPRYVKFYTAQWTLIGTKAEFGAIIAEITGIPIEVLSHAKRPGEYSVSERMKWASGRITTRAEDRAYCLMGLFSVNMPLLYGEGDAAFQRLQREIMTMTGVHQTGGLRLLVVDSNPLVIESFASQDDEPDYAILSHTWGTSEVSFQDILLGKAPSRKGYRKIESCCKQAARHGIKYLWVDTCCIDKTSSAELQEAICSMYKWYQKAKICFVHLEDFTFSNPLSKLSSCRWFRRGWTLREYIRYNKLNAPPIY